MRKETRKEKVNLRYKGFAGLIVEHQGGHHPMKTPSPQHQLLGLEVDMARLQDNAHAYSHEQARSIQQQYNTCLNAVEAYWAQRSRLSWAVLGDNNNRFFHTSVASRRKRNEIKTVRLENGEWSSDEPTIRRTFINHFKAIFCRTSSQPTLSLHQVSAAGLLGQTPFISAGLLESIQATPSAWELQHVFFTLNPDKAPGPDGMTARAIQNFWTYFGSQALNAVQNFFLDGIMPDFIARSNLILVPKKDAPVCVKDFRRISVCNVLYKVISKTLANRLQPSIPLLVLPNQTAFTKGRFIGDNVILFREVLHSFSMPSFSKHAFCYKCDLSKAFDRMRWDFLVDVLSLYGLPPSYIRWVRACLHSAKFSIVLNGTNSGGFISPTSGLRQGCAMSPYLFILGMDILSRLLQRKVELGKITGVKLSSGGPVLTSLIYADDLLIFGEASQNEVCEITETLELFCQLSGQEVGHDKSKIWFSRSTPLEVRALISSSLDASEATRGETYLGVPVAACKHAHFQPLLEKLDGKLQRRKARLLSQAGKATLIKAVAEPLLLYHMSATYLPKETLKAIQSKIRSFFWSSGDKRGMPMVAWSKVTLPKTQGGLGLRDVTTLNETMLLKNLFALASGKDSPWVNVVAKKYFPRGSLWASSRTTRCTHFWRAMLQVRPVLSSHIKWQLGDGRLCKALGQPWFEFWLHTTPQNAAQRDLVVSDLVDTHSNTWNTELLIQLFGFHTALFIAVSMNPPLVSMAYRDRLIFTPAANGALILLQEGI